MSLITCTCERCNGNGDIICPDCDGQGVVPGDFAHYDPPATHPRRAELLALKDDLRRVRQQAGQLKQLNPSRAGIYAEQLFATEKIIEKQAAKLLKS